MIVNLKQNICTQVSGFSVLVLFHENAFCMSAEIWIFRKYKLSYEKLKVDHPGRNGIIKTAKTITINNNSITVSAAGWMEEIV